MYTSGKSEIPFRCHNVDPHPLGTYLRQTECHQPKGSPTILGIVDDNNAVDAVVGQRLDARQGALGRPKVKH
jgi:hypothetical protein